MTNDSQASRSGAAGSRSMEDVREDARQPAAEASDKSSQKAVSGSKAKKKSRFTGWWYTRKLIVLALFAGALSGGLYVGFVVLGGGSMADAFNVATYKHIFDLVFSDS